MRGKHAARAARKIANKQAEELSNTERLLKETRIERDSEIARLKERIAQLEGKLTKEVESLADERVQAALASAKRTVKNERERIAAALQRAFSELHIPSTQKGLEGLGVATGLLSEWISADQLLSLTGSRARRRNIKKDVRSRGAIRETIAVNVASGKLRLREDLEDASFIGESEQANG